MVKNHLKRIAMPVTWSTKDKKRIIWVAKPNPGAHSIKEGMPAVLILRELLNHGNTTREVKHILHNKNVLVDGTRIKDHRYNIGLMDTMSIPELKEYYRIILNKYGKLFPIKIDEKEASLKLCRINGKGYYNGKIQLRLSSGRIILVDKGNYKTGDSILITVPEQKIEKHFAFEKDSTILITKGKNIGIIGTVKEIKKEKENKENMVVIKTITINKILFFSISIQPFN